MTRSERMKPVSRIAESRERDAAQAMAATREKLAQEEARHQELTGYRDDYAKRFEDAGRQGLAADKIADYRRMINQLNEALTWQGRRVDAARADYERDREAWLKTRQRVDVLDKATERFRNEERRESDRREQKETDERANHGRPRKR
jgi:flagellar FliJ protein